MIIKHHKPGCVSSEGSVCLVIISGWKVIVYRAWSHQPSCGKQLLLFKYWFSSQSNHFFFSSHNSIVGPQILAISPRFAFCVGYQSFEESIENFIKISSQMEIGELEREREGQSSLRISSREESLGGRAVLLGYASLPARQGDWKHCQHSHLSPPDKQEAWRTP